MATLGRMHWLLADPQGFDLYTDHNNLIYIFDPTSVVTDISQTTIRKVLRWAVRLSVYNYTCVHINGTDNVWADLLGRWSAALPTIQRLVYVPELPSSSAEDFEWPTAVDLYKAQQSAPEDARPPALKQENADALYKTETNAVWIPDEAADMQLRLCVIAHTGPAGHRGYAATTKALQDCFTWTTLKQDVKDFIRGCIHCLSTQGGGSMPRPFGPSFFGTKPNDLLQFDYIELGPRSIGAKYVLMLRDDHSGYCWFFAFPDSIAENAATAIIDWSAAFGVPAALMSDGPTHFRNETMRLITKGLRVPHHFTLPYCPWSNGAIERLGKELLRVARAVTAELQMAFDEWPDILPLLQSAINNAPSSQRKKTAPIMAFNGLPPTPPIKAFYRSMKCRPVTINDLQQERAFNVESLVKHMADLHPAIHEGVMRNRKQARATANRGILPNFDIGDYVLVARSDFFAGEKLALRWRGPRRVVKAVSNYIYTVEDLRKGKRDDVHISRLKFYRDTDLNREAIMSHVLVSETGMIVSRLMGLEETPTGLCVRVRWRGLPSSEETLEPIGRVQADVPQLFMKLLSRKTTAGQLAAKARRELGL